MLKIMQHISLLVHLVVKGTDWKETDMNKSPETYYTVFTRISAAARIFRATSAVLI